MRTQERGFGWYYPAGTPAPKKVEVEMECDKCGHTWEARGMEELGFVALCNDDDEVCPTCRGEGIEEASDLTP